MPSSCNYLLQDSFVQHFPTTHVDDLEERVNQLMATRHAHTQPPHTHTPHKSCSYCYHPSHRIDDCPFLNHYMIDEDDISNPYHKHVQATITIGGEEIVKETVDEPSLEDPLGKCFAQFGCDLDLDKLHEQANALLDSTLKM
jgi:hypothetical protein